MNKYAVAAIIIVLVLLSLCTICCGVYIFTDPVNQGIFQNIVEDLT